MRKMLTAIGLILVISAYGMCDTVQVPENCKRIVCIAGQTLNFSGTYSEQGYQSNVALVYRNQIIQSSFLDGTRPYAYSLSFTPPDVGIYPLKIEFSGSYLGIEIYRIVMVHCVDGPPPAILQVATTADLVDIPVTLTVNDTSIMHVWFCFDNQVVSDSGPPFTSTIPISKCSGEPCTLSFVCCMDSDRNDLYVSPTVYINVPNRVQIGETTATLHSSDDTTPLSVSLESNLTPVSVAYYVLGRLVASSTTPPFNVDADLTALPSGRHKLQAVMTMADGRQFISNDSILDLYNLPDDERIEQLEEAERNREAAEEEARAKESASWIQAAGSVISAALTPPTYIVSGGWGF